MDFELVIDKLLRDVNLLRRLELDDMVYLEVSNHYGNESKPIWSNHCYVYQVFKKDGSYRKLTFLDFMAFHLTKENFPEFFNDNKINLEDVVKRIKENKLIESYDVFDLSEIYCPEEKVHISNFNNTYDSFIVVTEKIDVADMLLKVLRGIGICCKKMLDSRFLEVATELDFKEIIQKKHFFSPDMVIGLDSFIGELKKANQIKFEFIEKLVELNFRDNKSIDKMEIQSDSISYIIELNDSKITDFLANILDYVSVKYNRMLIDKNLEVVCKLEDYPRSR